MSSYILYFKYINNIKKLLKEDYLSYQGCIKNTNILTCGRSISVIKKKRKNINRKLKKMLFEKPVKSLSKNIKKCSNHDVKYIVGIDTGPDYFTERFVYRSYYSQFKILRIYFFTGLSDKSSINNIIENENSYYNDIVLFPFISSYYTSALTVASEIKWIKMNCKKYRWYLHHQADVFIDINRTIKFIEKVNCTNCSIGNIVTLTVPRNQRSLHYIPRSLYSKPVWCRYINGPFMFFSYISVNIIVNLIGKVQPQIWVDDLYIGLILNYSNIDLINISSKFLYHSNRMHIDFIKNYSIIHNLFPSEIFYLSKHISYYSRNQ